MHAAYEDVLVTVIIVVADSDTHVVAAAGQPGFLSDIRKMAFSIIREQAVRIFGGDFLQCADIRAVREKDIELPSLL